MPIYEEPLTQKQVQAIAALISTPTVKAAANMVGVSVVTIFRWQQLSELRLLRVLLRIMRRKHGKDK